MKKTPRKPAATAATPAAASTGRASPPVEGTPAAPPPGAYLKMPTPAVSDFEKPTPELQRALAEWFADVFLQAAPGVMEKIHAKWTGNRTRAKRIQSAMNLATSAISNFAVARPDSKNRTKKPQGNLRKRALTFRENRLRMFSPAISLAPRGRG